MVKKSAKAGKFVTIEGRPVFVGGAGQGGGTAGGGSTASEPEVVNWVAVGAPVRQWDARPLTPKQSEGVQELEGKHGKEKVTAARRAAQLQSQQRQLIQQGKRQEASVINKRAVSLITAIGGAVVYGAILSGLVGLGIAAAGKPKQDDEDENELVNAEEVIDSNVAEKVRNWLVDDKINRDWLKMLFKLREVLGTKAGRFVTIEGRTVFIGGPGQGGGGSSGSGGGAQAITSTPQEEPEPDESARWETAARFEDANESLIEDWGRKHYEDALDEIRDTEEGEAVSIYSGDAYTDINDSLRYSDIPDPSSVIGDKAREHYVDNLGISDEEFDENDYDYVDEFFSNTITNLDSAIETGKAPYDMIAYRGLSSDFLEDYEIGEVFSDNGYTSTSLSMENAANFGSTMLEIRIPQGAPSLYLNGLSENMTERELLLGRGSEFKIVERTADNTIIVELMP